MTEETAPRRSAEPRSLTRRRLITGTLKFGAGAALIGSGVIVSATPASAVMAPSQPDWRYCQVCKALVYNSPGGVCPGSPLGHNREGSFNYWIYHNQGGSYNYALTHDLGARASMQPGWVYCGKCGGLYFKSERLTSFCAVNAFFGHQENGSFGYQLTYGEVE